MPIRHLRGKTISGDWRGYYEEIKASPQEAVSRIKRGARIFVGTACGEPQVLVRALIESQSGIEDTEIFHLLTLGVAAYTEPKFSSQFRHNSFFIGPSTRAAVQEGRADYIPIMLSQIPRLFREGRLPLDVALIQVSPPDEHGFCTYGIAVDIVKAAAESARLVIAQVNPRMPRTMGDSIIHVSDLDVIVPVEEPILEWRYPEETPVIQEVARNVAKLIPDGSTLQMGVGTIPNAALSLLHARHHLGVHTEVFSDGLIDLIEAGAITGAKKTLHPGKIIASFAMGTKRLYDYVNNNPFFEFRPTEYVNHPAIIARNDRLVAINVALEVDLTGQVNADSLGYRFYSGIGGQADFIRGAALSRQGKPIIAIPSTAKEGTVSRIVPKLSDGAGVVTTRGDVHYVVTEYGVAYLHGKNIRERTMALISIAHPDFRAELLAFAKNRKYVFPDQLLPLGSGIVYPEEYETRFTTKKGEELLVRPLKITDEGLVREMFYALSERTVYLRFFAPMKSLPHEKAQHLVNLDYQEKMAIGIFAGEEPNWKMVGLGQYVTEPHNTLAEAAILVRDEWQGQGIGGFLFAYLVRVARQRGVEGFTAEVLSQNQAMIQILRNSGYQMTVRIEEGVHLVEVHFSPADGRRPFTQGSSSEK